MYFKHTLAFFPTRIEVLTLKIVGFEIKINVVHSVEGGECVEKITAKKETLQVSPLRYHDFLSIQLIMKLCKTEVNAENTLKRNNGVYRKIQKLRL